jgi:DNA-binding CsgD family transcriptional regulator
VEEIEAWREAVRRATAPVGIIEIPSTRYIELSPAAWELVGPGHSFGLDVLGPDERKEAAAIINAAAAGAIDGTEARRRRWHRKDGTTIEVTVRGRAIRLPNTSFGLWVARDLSRDDSHIGSRATARSPSSMRIAERSEHTRARVTLDRQWRVVAVTGGTEALNDVLSSGVALYEAVDPDDLPRLLFAFAGATTRVETSVRLRVRTTGGHVTVEVEVARPDDDAWSLTLEIIRDPNRNDPATRHIQDLAASLRRIAAELLDVGAFGASSSSSFVFLRVPGVQELPDRQREIVVRLARGERVGTIASRMYLSASTVRNHLSAVYKTFGVHSQEELLAVLHSDESVSESNDLSL